MKLNYFMGKIISFKEFLENLDFFVQEAEKGKIFVYPTDTVYGIGGIFPDTLEKVFEIKKRPKNKKVSIITNLTDLSNLSDLTDFADYLRESVGLV
jgi:tRNA A37 threonylcarbamoyladenosine synthetase subunit TsaC/SUA5/YrdC